MSTLAFRDLDRRRRALGVSISRVIVEARLHPKTWLLAQNGGNSRQSTLKKISQALDRMAADEAKRPRADVVKAFVAVAELMVRGLVGRNRRLMRALTYDRARRRGRLPRAVVPVRLRMAAIYLAAVELEVGNAELARAIGSTRQNVHKARKTIEDLRDSDQVDTLLERCRALLKGGEP